jgi:EPS-associated MarR family transcriptional regulator
LLVRYKKLERSFLTLNHLAAAIIVLRKSLLKVNLRIISKQRERSGNSARLLRSHHEQTGSPVRAPTPPASDADLTATMEVLRLLSEQPKLSQRELSQRLGLSLGKTHYVLHALLDKGLVKMKNFKRSGNKLAYAYLLTPKGIKEKLRLTVEFLHRKEAEFEVLRATITRLRHEVQSSRASKLMSDSSL